MTYPQRLIEAQSELTRLDAKSARIAHARLAAFLVGLALAVAAIAGKVSAWGYAGAAFALAGFSALAVLHERLFQAERRMRLRVALNQRAIARLKGEWHLFDAKGERFLDPGHLYAPDLDLFGQGSLFQLIDETTSKGGEEELARWLSAPATPAGVRERQGAVQELAPLLDFRQALAVEGRLAMKDRADASRFIRWAESEGLPNRLTWVRPLPFLLPPLTLALYLGWSYELVAYPLFWLGLLAQLAVLGVTRKPFAALYEAVSAGEGGFVRFEKVFHTLESGRFSHPRLRALQAGLEAGGPAVSMRFAKFGRLLAFVELRQSAQMHAVLNWLLLWDVVWLYRLEDWRRRDGKKVRSWFQALYEFEALSSVAGYAHDRPNDTYPTLHSSPAPYFDAKGLGHPLLARPVRNNVALTGHLRALIVTGSNMSGKTTLLRSMGLAAVMAQAGMPVCAESLSLSPLAVLTSMRVKDSLERGVSYFYAEVSRMKALLDAAAAAQGMALFLVDELLLGTNSRERQIASREVMRLLLETGSCGAITTHDLSLTELGEQPTGTARNVHFRDQLTEAEGADKGHEKMTFDYLLRDGVVQTSNALRVLALAGIAVRDAEAQTG